MSTSGCKEVPVVEYMPGVSIRPAWTSLPKHMQQELFTHRCGAAEIDAGQTDACFRAHRLFG